MRPVELCLKVCAIDPDAEVTSCDLLLVKLVVESNMLRRRARQCLHRLKSSICSSMLDQGWLTSKHVVPNVNLVTTGDDAAITRF